MIVACPTCQRKNRLAATDISREVRCGACVPIFQMSIGRGSTLNIAFHGSSTKRSLKRAGSASRFPKRTAVPDAASTKLQSSSRRLQLPVPR